MYSIVSKGWNLFLIETWKIPVVTKLCSFLTNEMQQNDAAESSSYSNSSESTISLSIDGEELTEEAQDYSETFTDQLNEPRHDDEENSESTSSSERRRRRQLEDPISSPSSSFLQARHHSYLPGTAHPLVTESVWNSQKRHRSFSNVSTDDDGFCSLAILALPDVVVFPGMTIPLRWHDHRWLNYLQPQIRASRTMGKTETIIRIGILTSIDGEARVASRRNFRARNSWMRTAFRRLQPMHSYTVETLPFEMNQSTGDANQQISHDNWIGKVGTIVTITNTHENTGIDPSNLWQVNDESRLQEPLIVTALGIGRFCIVKAIDDCQQRSTRSSHRSPSDLRMYRVREFAEEDSPLPLFVPKGAIPVHHDRIIDTLAAVSMVPKFVWQNTWPWKLVTDIQDRLSRLPNLKDLTLPPDDHGPSMFSFWLASNLPLTQSEKLHLLSLESVLPRLQYLRNTLRHLEAHSSSLRCKICETTLASTASLFAVGGAEGTSGAYVNVHGIIHQTLTLQNAEETSLYYVGSSEIRDSWFPGYAWTITLCRYCLHHLGWKFDIVDPSVLPTSHRPHQFWGFSAGSVSYLQE
jgi:ATP-dependent protease La (LON) substrate-binding domain/Yippee zinc-binding/DNA-binding /Mis18, centromere assembly